LVWRGAIAKKYKNAHVPPKHKKKRKIGQKRALLLLRGENLGDGDLENLENFAASFFFSRICFDFLKLGFRRYAASVSKNQKNKK
jgi:hypothetical protein